MFRAFLYCSHAARVHSIEQSRRICAESWLAFNLDEWVCVYLRCKYGSPSTLIESAVWAGRPRARAAVNGPGRERGRRRTLCFTAIYISRRMERGRGDTHRETQKHVCVYGRVSYKFVKRGGDGEDKKEMKENLGREGERSRREF